jgi:hypothetical protein
MTSNSDLREAKRELSKSLLRPALLGKLVKESWMVSIEAAVACAQRNVHAVGIGRKIVAGEPTRTRCIRIYVVQKLPKSHLEKREVLPTEVAGIPTDIIESPPATFAFARIVPTCSHMRQSRQRPIIGGISTGHIDITAGTIACLCRSTAEGDDAKAPLVLSNNHVYANVNKAKEGDPILQPGPIDGGVKSDQIARLLRFKRILFGGKANRFDAAVGKLMKDTPFEPRICSIGKIKGTANAEEGLIVCKHGRTSGYTEGVITDTSVDVSVGMDGGSAALFEDQMRIERRPPYSAFGLGGDSGSLVVAKDGALAVGLYFAGPTNGGAYGLANPIGEVLTQLEIEIL